MPLPKGEYRVTLHLGEFWYRKPGNRTFDVRIEGELVLENFDPFAAGFAVAQTKEYPATVNDGILDIDFVERLENPNVRAIAIERIK